MRPQSTWPLQIAATLGCVLLAAGCSPHTKSQLLHFFFTGVDPTNQPPAKMEVTLSSNTVAEAVAAPAEPVVYSHKPFFEKKCTACHVSDLSQELRSNGSTLCLGCHDKLIGGAKYIHGPVSDGRCDLCHEAHESTERFLLTRKAQDLCLDCHEPDEAPKSPGHAAKGAAGCLECHDAHRSNLEHLVKARP